jgi:hypothetical protein
MAQAANAQAGTINDILSWNHYDNLPSNWKDSLGTLGYQVNESFNMTSELLGKLQKTLSTVQALSSSAEALSSSQKEQLLGSILEFGSAFSPYGTGDFLDFYAGAYNAALNAINGIALFSNNSLGLISGMTDAMAHGDANWQSYYSQIMQRLRNGGFAE